MAFDMWVEKLPVKQLDQFCDLSYLIHEDEDLNNVSSPISSSSIISVSSWASRMAHNAIVRNKTIIQDILSADAQFILNKVREKTLITDRDYKKLKTINKGNAEDLVIQLVDMLIDKGRESEFIEVLQDEIVLETYPKLKHVEWGVSGSSAVSSSSLKRSSERSLSEGKKRLGSSVYFYLRSKLSVFRLNIKLFLTHFHRCSRESQKPKDGNVLLCCSTNLTAKNHE